MIQTKSFYFYSKHNAIAFDKNEVMQWDAEEKRALAFELLDGIDEETIKQPLPDWKESLIRDRIEKDKLADDNVMA